MGENSTKFVVIGGLNPDYLAPNAPHQHVGTTDVDLMLQVGVHYDRDDLDFAWLERGLEAAGLEPMLASRGWQWRGLVGDAVVRVDLISDAADNPGQLLVLPGAQIARANNFSGPGAALEDAITRQIPVPEHIRKNHPTVGDWVSIRFAGLGGYLAAKSAALLSRNEDKDAYDLAFVLMYGPGGPQAAARAVTSLHLSGHLAQAPATVRDAVRLLTGESGDVLNRAVGQFLSAGDEATPEQLRQDIRGTAVEYLRSIDYQ